MKKKIITITTLVSLLSLATWGGWRGYEEYNYRKSGIDKITLSTDERFNDPLGKESAGLYIIIPTP